MNDDDAHVTVKPAWLAPILILTLVLAVYFAGKKKEEAVNNVVVDAAIITVLVFAMAAVFRKLASLLDAPGMAAFFGGPVQPHPARSTVDTTEGY